eukprot:jgi/Chrzof1/12901/Cz07g11180.t1
MIAMDASTSDMQEQREDRFHDAADHLANLVTANPKSVSDSSKLQLYGLYKQATTGDCNTRKPRFWDMSGKSKWHAWYRVKGMSQQQAMGAYVDLLTQLDPSWAALGPSTSGKAGHGKQQSMGPVFSTMAADPSCTYQQGSTTATLHEVAGQGDTTTLQSMLGSGASIDSRNEDGCTALHFAADRGQREVARLLIQHGADVNAVDSDGQTPLHYAALCQQQQMCEMLLGCGADASIPDAEGQTPQQVGPSSWTFWH